MYPSKSSKQSSLISSSMHLQCSEILEVWNFTFDPWMKIGIRRWMSMRWKVPSATNQTIHKINIDYYLMFAYWMNAISINRLWERKKLSLNEPMLTKIFLDTFKVYYSSDWIRLILKVSSINELINWWNYFLMWWLVALFFKLAWHSLARTCANYWSQLVINAKCIHPLCCCAAWLSSWFVCLERVSDMLS